MKLKRESRPRKGGPMALIMNADVPCRQWVLACMLLQPAGWKGDRKALTTVHCVAASFSRWGWGSQSRRAMAL